MLGFKHLPQNYALCRAFVDTHGIVGKVDDYLKTPPLLFPLNGQCC
jgi:hypothetical protein